jgi:hypothetical protein
MHIKIHLNLAPNTWKLIIAIKLCWVTANSKNKFYGIDLCLLCKFTTCLLYGG